MSVRRRSDSVEGLLSFEEWKDRRSDIENSEDERRRLSIDGSLKKKALNASNKLTHSLKKRGKRKLEHRASSFTIEDVRDEEEERSIFTFQQELLSRNLLCDKLNDYHTLLRFLKARKFDTEKAIHMWAEMHQWRKEFGADTILEIAEVDIKKEHKVLMVRKTKNFKKAKGKKGKFKKGGKSVVSPEKNPNAGPNSETVCFYCKGDGHWKRSCPKYLADKKAGKINKGTAE